jgi:hypothetical protein
MTASKVMVTEPPGARLERSIRKVVSEGALPVVIVPAVVVTDPGAKWRWLSRWGVIERLVAAVAEVQWIWRV